MGRGDRSRRGMRWQLPTAFHMLAQARAAAGASGVEAALERASEVGNRAAGHLMTQRRIEADRDARSLAARSPSLWLTSPPMADGCFRYRRIGVHRRQAGAAPGCGRAPRAGAGPLRLSPPNGSLSWEPNPFGATSPTVPRSPPEPPAPMSPSTSPHISASGGRGRSSSTATSRGRQNALAGCAEAGVKRFVHCGTEAALMAGQPLIHVDETAPLRPDSRAPYPATKAKAEQAVREASHEGFETVVVRPRLRLGQGRYDPAAGDGLHGRGGQVRLDRRRPQRHRHRARGQRGRGPDPRRREGPTRRGLLRHRRRARRLPRVRLGNAPRPRTSSRPTAASPAWIASPDWLISRASWAGRSLPLTGRPSR